MNISRHLCAVAVLAALSACAQQETTPPVAPAPQPEVVAVNAISAEAKVVAINHGKRIVTLRTKEGRTFDVQAGPEVRNFAMIKKGDLVQVSFYESTLIQLHKKGTETPRLDANEYKDRAALGDKPAGVVATEVTAVATIVKIDSKRPSVTLKGPKGNLVEVVVRDPKRLDGVKVGDLVEVSYTQAVAIEVVPAPKR